jgi:hypothetical protein
MPGTETSLLQPTARQLQKISSSTTLTGSSNGKAQCYSVYKNGAQHLEKIPCK